MKNIKLTLIRLIPFIVSTFAKGQNVDWPSYSGDNGSSKYSALNQINTNNVSDLISAWEWLSPDNLLVSDDYRIQWSYVEARAV